MAVTHYTITANFADVLGVAYPTAGTSRAPVVAWLETNVGSTEGVVDSVNDLILLGPSRQTADSSGQVVWADVVGSDSDSEDINLADGTLQYRVTAEYVNASTRRRGERWSSGWFSLTADVNLADVVAEQYAPAVWQTEFMEQAQELLDAQEAVAGLTGEDDAVAYLIEHASDTQTALEASTTALVGAGSTTWIKAVGGDAGFAFTSITTVDTTTGLVTAGNIKWPDGRTGVFAGTVDTNYYTGFTATYVPASGPTKTLTASGITYDSASGLPLGPTGLAVA